MAVLQNDAIADMSASLLLALCGVAEHELWLLTAGQPSHAAQCDEPYLRALIAQIKGEVAMRSKD